MIKKVILLLVRWLYPDLLDELHYLSWFHTYYEMGLNQIPNMRWFLNGIYEAKERPVPEKYRLVRHQNI